MITWQCKTFHQLSTEELYQIMYYRTQTFVVAQNRPYQEIDDVDPLAYHMWATKNGQLIAYFRIFKEQNQVSFGRVLTSPTVRGQGVGNQLMKAGLDTITNLYPGTKIVINSQEDKEQFYARYDFKKVGRIFTFHHTPHVKMVKIPK